MYESTRPHGNSIYFQEQSSHQYRVTELLSESKKVLITIIKFFFKNSFSIFALLLSLTQLTTMCNLTAILLN